MPGPGRDIAVVDPTFNSGGGAYIDTLRALASGGYRGKIALQSRLEMLNEDYLEVSH